MSRHRKRRGKFRAQAPRRDVQFVLDRFSHADLRSWQRMADGAERFWVGLYHHLESQRQLEHDALINALRNSPLAEVNDEAWFRLVDYAYSLQPLSMVGSMKLGGRFNIGSDLDAKKFPAFPALYLGSDYETAYAEKFGAVAAPADLEAHELALRTPGSFTAVRLRVHLQRLFDLRKVANLKPFVGVIKRFRITKELETLARQLGRKPPWLLQDANDLRATLLATDWRAMPVQFGIPANPQVFAELLVKAGFEGVIYPSAKGDGNCIAVFPENLSDVDSKVELVDPAPTGAQRISLNPGTLQEFLRDAHKIEEV